MPLAYVVYKITFPNGKIYIGKDIGSNGHSLLDTKVFSETIKSI